MARGTCTVRVRPFCLNVRHHEECFSPRAHLQAGFPHRTRRSHSEAATIGPKLRSCCNSASRRVSNRLICPSFLLISIYTLKIITTKNASRKKTSRNAYSAPDQGSSSLVPQPLPRPLLSAKNLRSAPLGSTAKPTPPYRARWFAGVTASAGRRQRRRTDTQCSS